MKICLSKNISFKRQLKETEKKEYNSVLNEAKMKIGNTDRSVIIVPATSLPNKTGVGNIGTNESLDFFDFAKSYWGVNEIQLLPIGQYHCSNGEYPIYSGTSMDLGNHIINVKKYIPESEYNSLKSNNAQNVDFANVVKFDSPQEKALYRLYESKIYQKDLENFKSNNKDRLEPKAIYRALREINNTNQFNNWNDLDKNLYNLEIVTESERKARISEVSKLKNDTIDFYYFKQFLAEKSLKDAKKELNNKGLKLDGDMLCGFSYDEVWSHPNAFHKNRSIGWGLPALNLDSDEGEKLLREKVKFYAERFDGIRVDAGWTYINQPLENGNVKEFKFYDDKILNIIEDEAKKIKGISFKNIMYEFSTSSENFNIYDNSTLKPCVKDRIKIYTSDYLSENWGSNDAFLKQGWNPDSFIIGTTTHDSPPIKSSNEQKNVLARILKLPVKKMQNENEFRKAKFAEVASAKNNMIFFSDALGLNEKYTGYSDKSLNYTLKISDDYKEKYFKNLEKGEAYNPMDALEKSFIAKGLDKSEPKLFKKIVKYRKILEQKEKNNTTQFVKIGTCVALSLIAVYFIVNSHLKASKQDLIENTQN